MLVAMVPYFKVVPATGETDLPPTEHFLVEKPYLELSYFHQLDDQDSEGESNGDAAA
jgi:hypothetical protein